MITGQSRAATSMRQTGVSDDQCGGMPTESYPSLTSRRRKDAATAASRLRERTAQTAS